MRLIFLFLFFPFSLFAQQKGWQELTISDGLSQGMIFDLKQDRKGFIWVATKDGLNRFDGYNFTVFTHDPYNDYSLSDNNCSALLIDGSGRLWVGTLNQGLNLFDTRTQRFYHIDIRDQASPKSGNYQINGLYEDPQGNIWVIANTDKLFKVSLPDYLKTRLPDHPDLTSQVQITQTPINREVGSKPINHLSFRPDGQALATFPHGLYWFNWQAPGKLGQFDPFRHTSADLAASYGKASQGYWFGTVDNKLFISRQGHLKTILLPYNVASLKEVDSVTIAIAADEFLWLMSPEELIRQDSLTTRDAFTTLPPNIYAITNIIKDQTGNVWVGTSGYGLRKFNPEVKQFHSSLANTTLTYLYADQQGRTYVRKELAYEQLDRISHQLRPFLSSDLPPPDKNQRYMMQDRRGTFWVSNTNFQTHEMSLFKFSSDWKLLKKYLMPINTAFGFYGNHTVEDQSGRLWLGTTNGKLIRFDPRTELFQVFSYQSLLPLKGSDIETYFLYFDQAGIIWIATQQGLVRADHPQTTPAFSIYKNSRTDRQSLSNDFVLSLLDDPYEPARYLWVATKGSGLDRLDKKTGHFEHITEAQGLPNKVVYGILADEYKNLWLSTNRGLAQFNPKTRVFKNYTKADGLQDDEFNTGSYAKTPSGELLFGGVNGLTAFRSSDMIRSTKQKPLVNIIGLKVNNEAIAVGGADGILAEGIEYSPRIDLSYRQNLLTLEFGVMDYTNSIKNRYRYRLEGIDMNWVEAGTNRFANYAQLPAGDYTFQVSGSPDGQLWSDPVTLQVRVHPPFYQTWWAYLLYAVGLAILAWQLYRFQTQRLLLQQQVRFEKKEASRLAELDGLKTQFFTNISHEFRTPLTLILGPIDQAVQDYAHDTRFPLIQRNANRLLSLINQLLDLSKLEAGQLKPEPERGDIAAFFRTVASSFNSLAESRQIRFLFEQNALECWADFDRDKVEKIVTNLLSNAFKFTPAGNEVRMTVRYSKSDVVNTMDLIIADTGIGIAPTNLRHIFERFYQVDGQVNRSYEGTGIGLALVNELVRVLQGTINVVSQEGEGTQFAVSLPLLAAPRPVLEQPSIALAREMEDVFAARESIMGVSRPIEVSPAASTTENVLLIIDDNADIRAYIRSIFDADYQIIEAVDGQDGLEQATTRLPDIVICDLMMPRIDGFGFCKALKSQEATSHIPVIMLTAKATVEDRIEGFSLGADDYLTKPFNLLEIQARVRNLIQQRQQLYQRFSVNQPMPAFPASVPGLPKAEQHFLDKLSAVVLQNLDNTAFSVEDLADSLSMSRVQLHRKLKAVANTTATQFIRDIRLAKAAELLTEGQQSVTQVAYSVGFDNLSYFAKVFQEHYGALPSQYGKSPASFNGS
ncbi:hybrid sensor histidine kinase/response regulator transcription factor [Spirosoma validum]|uniref:histidine kinase n=1 Tax=Spirosoma validum TaxID=2771355 RepID=A0A927B811_9BACT|nr:response regulator [Spirosoma validum]MBD2757431.1 response regulator [Spirosoma validum]